ncbi:hypothetical protein GI584_20315 [Gracilibacillus salitolerans]|uniref:ADP-ribosylglycohydrolase n=1 Tax=Gracilibacillus salitolerans TaxID=2663022 RepID=A0A5Q2TPY5_9BACI|nr:ADP-ribosylglycohydrolase family protein [Gracilibacillus salitolerans]QGH36241.1 hypothetical protein GI584_20315 [Gracilibacillus salitolerans]
MQRDYMEKVYAGWLGKVIGVRHGGNIEQWTYDRIERTFGEITGYLHDFKNFAADDDTNGPMFFIRALEDYTASTDITAKEMGDTWLNYAPDGHGFFWWGGYGISTENTAYLNLKSGIHAPLSGSITQNGEAVAEQIGGQIFIDVWGLIAPGDPQLASDYAEKMASVSHDGNGKYGGMFIAAAIAESFREMDMDKIIEAGLSVIPEDCEYASMTKDIQRFYHEYPNDWRQAFRYVYDHYGYDKYPGNCHIIPNSAVIVLSLLYGEGDFSQAINICNMCGWDTDCNVANVGTIMGVRNGLDGIPFYWREPINDFLCCSSVIGSLNILDLPWCASYIGKLGYQVMKQEIPKEWEKILDTPTRYFHFEYPGSTHAFRTEVDAPEQVTTKMENVTERAYEGNRSLKLMYDYANGGHAYRAFVKTYYTPDDFNDSRYDPAFSPILYPGQTIKAKVLLPTQENEEVNVRLYVKDRNSNKRYYSQTQLMTVNKWLSLEYKIPYMEGVCIEEAGVEFIPVQEERRHLELPSLITYVDNMEFAGEPDYVLDFQKEQVEHWNNLHKEVSQLTYLRGLWTLNEQSLIGTYHADEPSEAYTGDLNWKDYQLQLAVTPEIGDYHLMNFRVQGAMRSYAVGLGPDNSLILLKKNLEYQELDRVTFPWKHGEKYIININVSGSNITVEVNNEVMIQFEDKNNPYLSGQLGFSLMNGSRAKYHSLRVKGHA